MSISLLNIIDHKLAAAEHTAISVIDSATAEIKKVATGAAAELPAITADLNNPIIKAIAADLPGGTAILEGVTLILNEFQSAISNASGANVLQGLQNQAAAMITSLIHGAQKSIGDYIIGIVKALGL